MNFVDFVLTGVGLGMDAMSVSICKGLSMKKMEWKKAVLIGMYFGVFQMLMPLIGFGLGSRFKQFLEQMSKWFAFGVLQIIGINMIVESKKEQKINNRVDFGNMIALAVATSIDALVAGVSFGILKVSIVRACLCIGIITFFMSFWGVKIGNLLGNRINNKVEILGGIILISIGIKMLIV